MPALDVPIALADSHPGLRSVSIAASVLDCFAVHRELGATQVARELGVAKSTACRCCPRWPTGACWTGRPAAGTG